MASIHLIDGEKGGVGKSWVARTMIQYFIDLKFPYVAVEGDRSNPTMRNIFPDAKLAFFSEVEKLADVPDQIFDYAIKQNVIVNLPAQIHRAVSMWIKTKGVLNFATQNNVKIIKWWVCDGESDSIELFIKSLEYYQGEIPHVLIKNLGRCDDWDFFDSHQGLQKAITEYTVTVIDIPKLSDNKRILINAKNLTFEAAANYEAFGILGRNQITTYLRNAYSEFDSTGLLPKPQAPEVKKS
jgi:hypothetical protein